MSSTFLPHDTDDLKRRSAPKITSETEKPKSLPKCVITSLIYLSIRASVLIASIDVQLFRGKHSFLQFESTQRF